MYEHALKARACTMWLACVRVSGASRRGPSRVRALHAAAVAAVNVLRRTVGVVTGPHEADPVLGGGHGEDVGQGDDEVVEVQRLVVRVDAARADAPVSGLCTVSTHGEYTHSEYTHSECT